MIKEYQQVSISCKHYRISYYIKINLTTNHNYKLLWFRESSEVKYNIGFGIPIEFPSQKKKLFKSVHKQEIEVKYNIGFGIRIEFPIQ